MVANGPVRVVRESKEEVGALQIQQFPDDAITSEYYRRMRSKKAASVAAGGKPGGWPKGKKRGPKNTVA